jgi:hypothetical protein
MMDGKSVELGLDRRLAVLVVDTGAPGVDNFPPHPNRREKSAHAKEVAIVTFVDVEFPCSHKTSQLGDVLIVLRAQNRIERRNPISRRSIRHAAIPHRNAASGGSVANQPLTGTRLVVIPAVLGCLGCGEPLHKKFTSWERLHSIAAGQMVFVEQLQECRFVPFGLRRPDPYSSKQHYRESRKGIATFAGNSNRVNQISV